MAVTTSRHTLTYYLSLFILASRPKTLFAAISPVLVGTSIASRFAPIDPILTLLILLCASLIQIATNFTNDYYDAIKGSDSPERIGPARLVSKDLISKTLMKKAFFTSFILAFLLGSIIVYKTNFAVLLIGSLSIIFGYLYTGGPFPLAYHGLGDLFVFIFFGLIATTGTFYVHTLSINTFSFLSSIPIGFLLVNILVVNNLRDREQDEKSNKITLAVILGNDFTRLQYLLFTVFAYLAALFTLFNQFGPNQLISLPFLVLPLNVWLIRQIYVVKKTKLNKILALTSLSAFLYSLLFSLATILIP